MLPPPLESETRRDAITKATSPNGRLKKKSRANRPDRQSAVERQRQREHEQCWLDANQHELWQRLPQAADQPVEREDRDRVGEYFAHAESVADPAANRNEDAERQHTCAYREIEVDCEYREASVSSAGSSEMITSASRISMKNVPANSKATTAHFAAANCR